MLIKSKLHHLITAIALCITALPFVSAKNTLAQQAPVTTKNKSLPAGISCYLMGEVIVVPPSEEVVKQWLQDLKKLYEEDKISKETYYQRKINLLELLKRAKKDNTLKTIQESHKESEKKLYFNTTDKDKENKVNKKSKNDKEKDYNLEGNDKSKETEIDPESDTNNI